MKITKKYLRELIVESLQEGETQTSQDVAIQKIAMDLEKIARSVETKKIDIPEALKQLKSVMDAQKIEILRKGFSLNAYSSIKYALEQDSEEDIIEHTALELRGIAIEAEKRWEEIKSKWF